MRFKKIYIANDFETAVTTIMVKFGKSCIKLMVLYEIP